MNISRVKNQSPLFLCTCLFYASISYLNEKSCSFLVPLFSFPWFWQGKEEINEEGDVEIKVDTVDHRTPPGEEGKEPKKEGVTVVHLTRKGPNSAGGGGGVLAGAAAAVAKTLKSAKDSGSGQDKTRE